MGGQTYSQTSRSRTRKLCTQTVWPWGRRGQTSGTEQGNLEVGLAAHGNAAPAKVGVSRQNRGHGMDLLTLRSEEVAAMGCPGGILSFPQNQSLSENLRRHCYLDTGSL